MIHPSQAQQRLAQAPPFAPPCQGGCPVVTPVQKYVNYISQGRFEESLREIMAYNPFPSSCGRVCFHPCEDNCRRGQVDEPISIMALKRFVSDRVRESGNWPGKQDMAPRNGKKVAVIGSGPAGLTAAYDLTRLGFSVTVFDKASKPGGMLRNGILDYRLPQDMLDWDCDYILSHDIKLRTGVSLVAPGAFDAPSVNGDGTNGAQASIDSLMEAGYESVIITTGLSASRGLPIANADAEGAILAVPFLKSVNEGSPMKLGNDVLVIGGGNVAVDVARSAARVSGGKVKMCCLESREEMPAHDWEVRDAIEEGIEMHCSRGPNAVTVDSQGRVTGLELKEVECVFDAEGRFNPSFREDVKHVLTADTIIMAIGQMSELGCLENTGVEVNERGQLIVDRSNWMTTRTGVFAGGEVAAGPGAAIMAVASGHTVAANVAEYLGAEDARKFLPAPVNVLPPLPEETAKLVKKEPRAKMPMRQADGRVDDFGEIELGLTEYDAVREAQRCMNCAAGATVIGEKCTSCLTCVRVCPYEVPVISDAVRVAEMDPVKCQSCGICAAECPANAIEISMEIDRPGVQLFEEEAASRIVGFFCRYGAYGNPSAGENLKYDYDGVSLNPVMCTGRLEENDILRAFDAGAEAVFVVSCPDVTCHHNHGSWRLHKRIDHLRGLLDEIGIGGDKLFSFVTYPAEGGFADFISEVENKLNGIPDSLDDASELETV